MTRIERAARALCRFQGLPENTQYEGRRMWESFIAQAAAVVEAIDEEPKTRSSIENKRGTM
jgi:hypothetical protein